MARPAINMLAILGRACQDLLFPPSCLGCRTPLPSSQPPLFCDQCLGQLQWLKSPLCPGCGQPWPPGAGGDHYCGTCLQKPPHFSRARAALLYHGPIRVAIQACKYHGDLAGLASFAALAGRAPARSDALTGDPAAWDYILPVPLHVQRLRERGFNQALLLARAFFPRAKEQIRPDLLLRQRWTEPQTGMSGRRRRRNLRDAFVVDRPREVKNRRILLVDDVFTTGSTGNECARVLKAAGAAEVAIFTLARVR